MSCQTNTAHKTQIKHFSSIFVSTAHTQIDTDTEKSLLTNDMKSLINRELKQSTTTTAMRTAHNKSFNEQNNSCARAL